MFGGIGLILQNSDKGNDMGIFDSYFTQDGEEVQLKTGSCGLISYHIGDCVELDDGVYYANEGVVVISGGEVAEVTVDDDVTGWNNLPRFDKYGDPLEEDGDPLEEDDEDT